MFRPDLSKGRGRVRVDSCDGRDGVTGGPALRVQVLHRLDAGPTNSAKRVGEAVGDVSESLSGANGVEDGSEQMGTKEVRRVAGQAGGVILDGSGPQGRRVEVDPLAHVFPSEGGETGFVVFKDERTEITLRRIGWGFDATKCPEEGEASRDVRSDLHRSGAATPGGGISSAEERGDVAAGGVAERLSEAQMIWAGRQHWSQDSSRPFNTQLLRMDCTWRRTGGGIRKNLCMKESIGDRKELATIIRCCSLYRPWIGRYWTTLDGTLKHIVYRDLSPDPNT